jgi:hypothetical protein
MIRYPGGSLEFHAASMRKLQPGAEEGPRGNAKDPEEECPHHSRQIRVHLEVRSGLTKS